MLYKTNKLYVDEDWLAEIICNVVGQLMRFAKPKAWVRY